MDLNYSADLGCALKMDEGWSVVFAIGVAMPWEDY